VAVEVDGVDDHSQDRVVGKAMVALGGTLISVEAGGWEGVETPRSDISGSRGKTY